MEHEKRLSPNDEEVVSGQNVRERILERPREEAQNAEEQELPAAANGKQCSLGSRRIVPGKHQGTGARVHLVEDDLLST